MRSRGFVRMMLCYLCLAGLYFASDAQAQVAPPATAPRVLPTPLTLADAIAIALQQQPRIYTSLTQITAANGQKQQARSQYFPTVTPTFQYQDSRDVFYGIGGGSTVVNTGTGSQQVITQSTDTTTVVRGSGSTITLKQNLYDGGLRESLNAQARRTLDAARAGQTDARQQVILTVTQNFYERLRAQDLVKVSQAQVARAQQTVTQTQGQIDAGVAARTDILQSKADLATAQVSLLQNQSGVRTTEASLKNALGIETDSPLQLAPLAAADALPPMPTADQTATLDTYVQQAYAARPDLRQQQATIAASQQSVKQAQINAGLLLSGNYLLTYQPTNDVGVKGTTSQVLATLSYPLFDAGNARGAVRIAEANRDANRDQLEQLRQSVRLDVEQSYYDRDLAFQRIGLAQAAIDAAQASFDAATERRQAGVGTVLDITTAQVTLTQAQNQYVTAIYDYYEADARLRRAIGQNDAGQP